MVTLKLAALEAWLGLSGEHTETCRRVLQDAANTNTPSVASRAAQGYCLLPGSDPNLLKAARTLARRAVELGGKTNDAYVAWFQLCLGMAEYRNSDYRAADAALTAAEQGAAQCGADRPLIGDAARFYRVMSLFRQGQVEAARNLFDSARAEMKPLPADGQALETRADHDDFRIWLAFKEASALLAAQAGRQ
jgi:hypothetical protein